MSLDVASKIRVQKSSVIEKTQFQSTTGRHYHVTSVEPDGTANLNLYIDEVKLSYSFNDNPMITYDTKSGDFPPRGFEKVKECVGKSLAQIKLSRQGKLLRMTVPDHDPTEDPSQNFLDVLPDHPVHIGDEWFDDMQAKVVVSRSVSQKITLRRRYKLEAVNGNIARIAMRTAEITLVTDPQIRSQLVQMTPEGTILFDMKQGMTTMRETHCSRTEVGIMGPESSIAATSSVKGTLR